MLWIRFETNAYTPRFAASMLPHDHELEQMCAFIVEIVPKERLSVNIPIGKIISRYLVYVKNREPVLKVRENILRGQEPDTLS